MINQTDLEAAKSRIVDVIDSRMPLKRRGSTWWASCPFHNEKTASFAVSESKGRFKCFSCGVSGDTVDFIKKYHQTDFRGAVAILGLARRDATGYQVSEHISARQEKKQRQDEMRAQGSQYAAGLRYVRRLIANIAPLERHADWFTAELLLDQKLDALETELRK